jgi:hypothetical protein
MEQTYYDTTLRLLSDDVAMYEWQGKTMQRPRLADTTWLAGEIGQIGVLVVNERSDEAGFFQPYLEQRLRRAMQYDVADRWGWTLEGAGCAAAGAHGRHPRHRWYGHQG